MKQSTMGKFIYFCSLLYKIIGPQNSYRLAMSSFGKFIARIIINDKNGTVIANIKYGFQCEVSPYEYYISGFLFLGETNPFETHLVRTLLKKGDVFIDVGAHIGWYALNAAQVVGSKGKVYAFEPNISVFEVLKRNKSLNHFQNLFPESIALSNKTGKREFWLGDDMGGSFVKKNTERLTIDGRKVTKTNVQTISLDKFCEINNIQNIKMIKIDVEGAELDVLKGSYNILKKQSPYLLIEVIEECLIANNTSKKELFLYLQKLGYIPYEFTGQELIKIDSSYKGSAFNIFFSKNPIEQKILLSTM